MSTAAQATPWLAQLAPAHAPPPPGWWPPAPGWWLLAALLAAAALLLFWLQRRPRRAQRRLRRQALRQLAAIAANGGDAATQARAIEDLLRRYAVARFGRSAVAALSGARWIDFIVAHGGVELAAASGENLLRAAWGGPCEATPERWLRGAEAFIRGR